MVQPDRDHSRWDASKFVFLAGLVLIIGPRKTGTFFFRRTKWRGSLAFLVGLALILWRRPVWGMAIEFFGFLNLFGYWSASWRER